MSTARLGNQVHLSDSTPEGAPTVVLVGSLGSDRSMWDAQAADLSREFRVVAVDLPGHGDSEVPPGPYSIAGLAADVIATLDSLDIRSAHVVGLSIGGAVAQWIGLHHSERVDSLTFMCTAPRFGQPEAWRERAATVRADGVEAVADAVAARWVTPAGAEADPDLFARLRRMIVATPVEGYAGCCDALADFDVTAELPRIDRPTLVIAGDEDPSTAPDVVRAIAESVPGARFELLSPAAHVPAVELPEQVTELLREHVRRVAAGPGRAE